MAFWFEYLTRERLGGKEDVLLVPGSISYLLANSGALFLFISYAYFMLIWQGWQAHSNTEQSSRRPACQ